MQYLALSLVLFLAGCMPASQHRESVQDKSKNKLTVGLVQRDIKVGMSGADVATILGSPNIVSTDEKNQEVWIYDKISTEEAYSRDSGGAGIGALGGAILPKGHGMAGGSVGVDYSKGAGASSRTQKTLTVVIKFSAEKKVANIAYHASTF